MPANRRHRIGTARAVLSAAFVLAMPAPVVVPSGPVRAGTAEPAIPSCISSNTSAMPPVRQRGENPRMYSWPSFPWVELGLSYDRCGGNLHVRWHIVCGNHGCPSGWSQKIWWREAHKPPWRHVITYTGHNLGGFDGEYVHRGWYADDGSYQIFTPGKFYEVTLQWCKPASSCSALSPIVMIGT